MPRADAAWPRDHAAAAARVGAHLPPGSRARLRPIGEGDHSFAFLQHRRVVRVAKHAEAAAALAREACVLAAIAHRLPLPVPQPRFVHADEGCAFSVHAHLRGAALDRARWALLPADARERTAAALGDFLSALHTLPVDAGRRCAVPALDLAAEAAALRPALARMGTWMEAPTLQRIDSALRRWAATPGDAAAPALLHRDVAPGHVLHDRRSGELTGIIDWGDLAIGDPARDFVYVHEDFGPAMLAAVLRGYAREPAATLLPRMHAWAVVEALAWTVERADAGARDDVVHGIAEVLHALDLCDEGSA